MPLTNDQSCMLEDKFKQIREGIENNIIYRRNTSYRWKGLISQASQDHLVNSACSYIPTVLNKEYNSKYSKDDSSFVKYISMICVYRLMDELNIRKDKRRKDIDFTKYYKRSRRYKQYKNSYTDKEKVMENLAYIHKGFDECEWEDFKQNLLKKMDIHFDISNNKDNVYRALITEYLLPICENEDHKTLKAISQDFNLTEGRMSQVLNCERMSKFVESCFNE